MRRNGLVAAATAAGAAGVGSLVAIHPFAPPAAVAGIAAAAWTFASSYRALLGFIVVLYLRPADIFPPLAALQPAKLFALGALSLWALEKILRRDGTWPRNHLDRWFVWLTFALLASCFNGTDPGRSLATFQDIFVKIIILYVLILNLVDTPKRAAIALTTIAVADAALGVYALQAKITGTATIEGSRAAFVGLLGDPNDLALVLLMAMPFLASVMMEKGVRRRWAYGVLLVAVVAGIVSTQSRGGFLGMGAAGFILLQQKVKSRALQLGILAFGMVALMAVSGMSKRSSGGAGTDGIDESAQGRLDAWMAGARMVKRHPILGVGMERFADNYPAYVSNAVIWTKLEAHNTFVKAIAETGFVGFIPFMAMVVLSFRSAWRTRQKRHLVEDPVERAAAGAMFPTIVAFFISAFFLSQCWNWFTYILLALIAATERSVDAATEGATT